MRFVVPHTSLNGRFPYYFPSESVVNLLFVTLTALASHKLGTTIESKMIKPKHILKKPLKLMRQYIWTFVYFCSPEV